MRVINSKKIQNEIVSKEIMKLSDDKNIENAYIAYPGVEATKYIENIVSDLQDPAVFSELFFSPVYKELSKDEVIFNRAIRKGLKIFKNEVDDEIEKISIFKSYSLDQRPLIKNFIVKYFILYNINIKELNGTKDFKKILLKYVYSSKVFLEIKKLKAVERLIIQNCMYFVKGLNNEQSKDLLMIGKDLISMFSMGKIECDKLYIFDNEEEFWDFKKRDIWDNLKIDLSKIKIETTKINVNLLIDKDILDKFFKITQKMELSANEQMKKLISEFVAENE